MEAQGSILADGGEKGQPHAELIQQGAAAANSFHVTIRSPRARVEVDARPLALLGAPATTVAPRESPCFAGVANLFADLAFRRRGRRPSLPRHSAGWTAKRPEGHAAAQVGDDRERERGPVAPGQVEDPPRRPGSHGPRS